MVNPFLSDSAYDTETAVMLERAYIHNIGNAVAYTDGDRVFMNTEENLFRLLPAYNDDMLKWLLWHERMHLELKHHNRFFKYVDELDARSLKDKFHVTKEEVNIIMDILVHDWMATKFPELVPTAKENVAQFRNCNSLNYTFKTFTLEEMLDEYAKHKRGEEPEEDKTEEDKAEEKEEPPTKESDDKSRSESESKDKDEPKEEAETEQPHPEEPSKPNPDEHDTVDWEPLEHIDTKEFITEDEGDRYIREINKIKRTKIKLARLAKTLNGLVTNTKMRSYKTPSHMMTGQNTIFKGSKTGKASLYLCFDASGSMSRDMDMFKEIISQAIPQAMKTPTTWFSGWGYTEADRDALEKLRDKDGRSSDYYKGTFKDFMRVDADDGYSDDGDRTIELCYKAEQEGYSPIGVTDGGGGIYYTHDILKKLKRTVLVGHKKDWLEEAKRINPAIQIIYIGREDD